MITLIHTLVAVLVSLICLVLLAKTDLKRHRRDGDGLIASPGLRRALGWICFAPCLPLFFMESYTALLVWSGVVFILGWLLAVLPARMV